LEAAGLRASDLDMIIVGTVTGDTQLPATAAYVQQKLGARSTIPAFDISAACAGFIYGMTIADQFLASGQSARILVIGVELLSRFLTWKDRTTGVLLGEGAGAVVLGPADTTSPAEQASGILSTRLHTDGSLTDVLLIPSGGSTKAITHQGLDDQENK